jgi:hypothetical protein
VFGVAEVEEAEPCAWHSSPEEIAQVESPDICERCSGQVTIQSTPRRQVNKISSYAERFSLQGERR